MRISPQAHASTFVVRRALAAASGPSCAGSFRRGSRLYELGWHDVAYSVTKLRLEVVMFGIADWGGFEKLVAELHDTGNVVVERDVVLLGAAGVPRQIDVLVRHRQDLYEHRVLVECKYWKKRVSRLHVDALATAVNDLAPARGVIFSAKGFQEGAVAMARKAGIDLFLVRELTDAEWGMPGRVVDIYLQIWQRSIGEVRFPGAKAIGSPQGGLSLALHLGAKGGVSHTPVIGPDGTASRTLESILSSASMDALEKFTERPPLFNGGAAGTHYLKASVNCEIGKPLIVPTGGRILILPQATIELGMKVKQSRITRDRAKGLQFALAVEQCLSGAVSIASRPLGGASTKLVACVPAATKTGKPIQNGSLLCVVVDGFFPFSETSGRRSVPFEQIAIPRYGTE